MEDADAFSSTSVFAVKTVNFARMQMDPFGDAYIHDTQCMQEIYGFQLLGIPVFGTFQPVSLALSLTLSLGAVRTYCAFK